MPHIMNPIISGVFNIGSVQIEGSDGTEAEVTEAGLAVDIGDHLQSGDSVYCVIDSTMRRLDTSPLALTDGYPMDLELEAQNAPCWIKQGDSSVVIPGGHLTRILMDEWRVVTVSGVGDAYFSCLLEPSATGYTTSGVLVATRIDSAF